MTVSTLPAPATLTYPTVCVYWRSLPHFNNNFEIFPSLYSWTNRNLLNCLVVKLLTMLKNVLILLLLAVFSVSGSAKSSVFSSPLQSKITKATKASTDVASLTADARALVKSILDYFVLLLQLINSCSLLKYLKLIYCVN